MILVTGATGTVGRALIERLIADKHPARATTRKPEAAALPADVASTRHPGPPTIHIRRLEPHSAA